MTTSLADEDAIQKASLRDRAVTLGIITDKRRLEAGQSTSNISVLGKLIVQAEERLGKPVGMRPVSEPSSISESASGPLLQPKRGRVRGRIKDES